MFDTELLQHSKLNCTVWWTMIASSLPIFIRIVCFIFIYFTFKTSYDNFFLIFYMVLGPMFVTELLQHSKLNCTVWWTMIESSLPIFIRIVCWIFFFNFTFKTSYDNLFLKFKIILGPMFDTELMQHYKLNCTVWWTMIASGPHNFIRIVCWEFL